MHLWETLFIAKQASSLLEKWVAGADKLEQQCEKEKWLYILLHLGNTTVSHEGHVLLLANVPIISQQAASVHYAMEKGRCILDGNIQNLGCLVSEKLLPCSHCHMGWVCLFVFNTQKCKFLRLIVHMGDM